jgi:hypothetical protein
LNIGNPEGLAQSRPNENIVIDAVGVGAPKCGTSWLAACLSEHPMVCMARPSTLNYFCDSMLWPEFRGPSGISGSWLEERFSHCHAGQRLVEISPNYLYDNDSPRRIFEHNPHCRLLFNFRHPVETLVSFYYQIMRESPLPNTFEEFVSAYPEVRRIGLYHTYVQQFLAVFPREQCLFLLFDDIQRQPLEALNSCFSFLRIRTDFRPGSFQRRVNERRVPRSRVLTAMLNKLRHALQDHASPKVWNALIWKTGLYRLHEWIAQRNLKPARRVAIDLSTRNGLLQYFRDDTLALQGFLGRDLSAWMR